jgi:hypothetical protein
MLCSVLLLWLCSVLLELWCGCLILCCIPLCGSCLVLPLSIVLLLVLFAILALILPLSVCLALCLVLCCTELDLIVRLNFVRLFAYCFFINLRYTGTN